MKIAKQAARVALLSTISIASLGIGSMAVAQDDAAAAAEEAEVDEDVIVVTATKREQTLEQVPVAVSVTSSAEIERAQVRDLNDLQTLVPSLRVSQLQSSANTNFIIRGLAMAPTTPALNHRSASSSTAFIVRVRLPRSATFPICSASKCCVVRSRPCSAKTHRQA